MQGKQLIVNAHATETRIALLEHEQVTELYMERTHDRSTVGCIYKGTVIRVLPGMNAAFVDIGLSRSAFLFGGDAFEPGAMDSFEEDLDLEERFQKQRVTKTPIQKILREGQEILVQVSKDPLGTKGPRVTMQITLPGRYLVLMPFVKHHGISRRIEDERERERLGAILKSTVQARGLILRTAAKGVEAEVLEKEIVFLSRLWEKIERHISIAKCPSLIYSDLDIVKRCMRDVVDADVKKIVLDGEEAYLELKEFLDDTMPEYAHLIECYQGRVPIFDVYGIEIDIARALSRKVDLPSGGYLVIDETEALTTFDVNTGKFVGKASSRTTILDTNLEAVVKIVEQLRVRNIGGLIVVDFIDMDYLEDKDKVFDALQEELKKDRARSNVLKISDLGLVQMTRKRTFESLSGQLLSTCPHCLGLGLIRSVPTDGHELLREMVRFANLTRTKRIGVRLRPAVEEWVTKHLGFEVKKFEREFGVSIHFFKSHLDDNLLREPSFDVFDLDAGKELVL